MTTVNPYPQLAIQVASGLDAIGSALTAASTVDDLVDEVYNFVSSIYYIGASSVLEMQIKSVAYNAINAYVNSLITNPVTTQYTEEQLNIIYLMIGDRFGSIDGLLENMKDIEDNITKADLNLNDQQPLLMATAMAIESINYWQSQVASPTNWSAFLTSPMPINYANIPFWVTALSMGGLIGAKTTSTGMIIPADNIVVTNIASALIGALTIGAGKVIFKWVNRIQPKSINYTSDIQLTNLLDRPLNDGIVMGGNNNGGGANRPWIGISSKKSSAICICGHSTVPNHTPRPPGY